jgi:hypothetical protein
MAASSSRVLIITSVWWWAVARRSLIIAQLRPSLGKLCRAGAPGKKTGRQSNKELRAGQKPVDAAGPGFLPACETVTSVVIMSGAELAPFLVCVPAAPLE